MIIINDNNDNDKNFVYQGANERTEQIIQGHEPQGFGHEVVIGFYRILFMTKTLRLVTLD